MIVPFQDYQVWVWNKSFKSVLPQLPRELCMLSASFMIIFILAIWITLRRVVRNVSFIYSILLYIPIFIQQNHFAKLKIFPQYHPAVVHYGKYFFFFNFQSCHDLLILPTRQQSKLASPHLSTHALLFYHCSLSLKLLSRQQLYCVSKAGYLHNQFWVESTMNTSASPTPKYRSSKKYPNCLGTLVIRTFGSATWLS